MVTLDQTSLGIVLSGGGTQSAFQVGALYALAKVHKITTPKVLVALSGGAGPGTFYLAGRFQNMYAWGRLFDDPRLISWKRLWNGPILDVHFLIDGILAKQAPYLDHEVWNVRTKYFLAATKLPEGTPHWFTRWSGEPLFAQLKATKNAAGVSHHSITINGVEYTDGTYTVTLEMAVQKAFDEGAEHVLVIDNSTHGKKSLFTRKLMRFGVRHAPEYIRDVVIRASERISKPLKSSEKITVCRAGPTPVRHGLERRSRCLRATIQQGYEEMARLVLPWELP